MNALDKKWDALPSSTLPSPTATILMNCSVYSVRKKESV